MWWVTIQSYFSKRCRNERALIIPQMKQSKGSHQYKSFLHHRSVPAGFAPRVFARVHWGITTYTKIFGVWLGSAQVVISTVLTLLVGGNGLTTWQPTA